MRRIVTALAALAIALATLPAVARSLVDTPPVEQSGISGMRAGVGVADATWHVGANAGQHASSRAPQDELAGETDPHSHSKIAKASYGTQSRLTMRAIVVEGSNAKRVALVKTDGYLAQDNVQRRVAQLLESGTSGITYDKILIAASHNHSSPYNVSPSPGVAGFQDAFDIRQFEYYSRAIATAISRAAADLKPATMGATTIEHGTFKANVVGPQRSDDGTPSGYPLDFGDNNVVIARFDAITQSGTEPLATWVNFGMHPESLDSYDLNTADYLAPLERFVDAETGAPMVFSQGDVGSSEGPSEGEDPRLLPDGTPRAWYHTGFAQAERGARLLADAVLQGWHDIGAGKGQIDMSSDVPVETYSALVPGPVSHPYPAANSCRTERTAEGTPGIPNVADCNRDLENDPKPGDPHELLIESMRERGVPVPENYDTPAFGALEENNRIHLQAIRFGEMVLSSCSCEAQVDLIVNFESRADDVKGNIFDGFDWGELCSKNADTTRTCSSPAFPGGKTVITDFEYQRMQAQVHNDAKGWDDPAYAPYANAEPADVTKIKGNFTKEELPKDLGYKIAVGIGHAGDYNGYTVSYREFMARDHYRKSLTSYGAHTADYMVTRMVRMAGALKGGPQMVDEPLQAAALADEARQVAFSRALGQAASAAYDAYEAGLADDKNVKTVLTQPVDITRFNAATYSWVGGSNAVDNPTVRVERQVAGAWKPYAAQKGEVQTIVTYPMGVQGVASTRTGSQEWRWTASFEAYDAYPRTTIEGGQVPNGTYRFVVDGAARTNRATAPYHLESNPFEVRPWGGITVDDLRAESGAVSFRVAPIAYPRTYTSPIKMVKDDGKPMFFCRTCSFRPWARTADIVAATVTVTRADGSIETVQATRDGDRWTAPVALGPGDSAEVASGSVRDAYGETNGAAISITG